MQREREKKRKADEKRQRRLERKAEQAAAALDPGNELAGDDEALGDHDQPDVETENAETGDSIS